MIDELVSLLSALNTIENKKPSLEKELKELDNKTQDLLHDLEYNEFSVWYIAKLAFELQDIRRQRRKKKNELELLNCLITHSLRLNNIANREFLIQSLRKTYKDLITIKWTNRSYTQEELNLKFVKKENIKK